MTGTTSRLLVVDNYDSFTWNLVQMFMGRGLEIDVIRSDEMTLTEAVSMKPDYLLVSPGPKDPSHTGISIPLIRYFYRRIPILGVCLGMQCINEVFSGTTEKAPVPVHGKTSRVFHDGAGIFRDIPSPFTAARYHSLVVKPGSGELAVTARTDDSVIMGIAHRKYPVYGVQFHPESFMTSNGSGLIDNFLTKGFHKRENAYDR